MPIHDLFSANRPLVLFAYGQTFFILGLAIFLQYRKHSRLRLARDLLWLAAFGLLHGIYEWGDILVPLRVDTPTVYQQLIWLIRTVWLAISFACLFMFGAVTLQDRWPQLPRLIVIFVVLWIGAVWWAYFATPTAERWLLTSTVWTRYLLGLPAGLLAAFGLRHQAETVIAPLGVRSIYRTLRLAGISLFFYAIFAGLFVAPADFWPANWLNRGVLESSTGLPIEVFRSAAGLVLTWNMLRVLEIFEIEIDRMIEHMQEERIQDEERQRIGQEIHDGAIQAIYSASLMLEAINQKADGNKEVTEGIARTKKVLQSAVTDLRKYIVSLQPDVHAETLLEGLQKLASDPRFASLLRIQLKCEADPKLTPIQIGHIIAITQEGLSNSLRHANAKHVTVLLRPESNGFRLQICDDGQGFVEKEVTPGFGLRSIRDRTRLLGATLSIDSQRSKGTTVTLKVPEEAYT
jgi:signal transduction histidine kinase